VDRNGGMHS